MPARRSFWKNSARKDVLLINLSGAADKGAGHAQERFRRDCFFLFEVFWIAGLVWTELQDTHRQRRPPQGPWTREQESGGTRSPCPRRSRAPGSRPRRQKPPTAPGKGRSILTLQKHPDIWATHTNSLLPLQRPGAENHALIAREKYKSPSCFPGLTLRVNVLTLEVPRLEICGSESIH